MAEGEAPRKGRAMTVIELRKWFEEHEAELSRRVDTLQERCDGCQHDCGCPERIDEVEESAGRRMDVIDANVETVQSNLEKAYDNLSEFDDTLVEHIKDIRAENERNRRTMEIFALIAGASGAICAVVIGLSMTGNL
jgi:hypothetical protein